ncbi:MAG TPA: oxidoreductase [Nevskiaceae bacterium]|nr:oxidoreductase [Nevskiaceae bacterium]
MPTRTLCTPRTWFITGASRGLGQTLASAVLAHGDRIVVTARKPEALAPLLAQGGDRARGHQLDVTDARATAAVVKAALADFGGIDVLVNNAGYGLAGAVEELDDDQIRTQFETNVFGALRVTRAFLPHFRAQGHGHILQISSIAGIAASAGLGIYNSSKFALEGFSAALAEEVAPFGIRVTLVEPGPFRTDWAGPSLITPRHRIEAYAATAHQRIAQMNGYSGHQPGDPAKAAQVMIEAVESPNPPLHLPLGAWAIARMRGQIDQLHRDLAAWETRALDTAFPAGE